MTSTPRTAIQAGWVVAFDGRDHRPLRDGTVVIEGQEMIHVGRDFIEDVGHPQFYYSGLFEMLPVRGAAQDAEGGRACVDFSMAERKRA